MTFAAGVSSSRYKDRCTYELRCICQQRGDRNVFVDGKGPYCIIFDREYNKVEFEEMGVNTSKIEALWLEDDCIPIKKKSKLVSGGETFTVTESPQKLHDGWVKAILKLDCEC